MRERPSKRGQGEGSWRQRPNGLYELRVSTPAGRRSYFGHTKGEARAKYETDREQLDMGQTPAPARLTVAKFLQQWLADVVKPHKAYRTYTGYEANVRLHLSPAIGKTPLVKLTNRQVQRLVNEMQAAGLAPRTIQHARDTLAAALETAITWGLVRQNVAKRVTLPTVRPHPVPALTAEQAKTMLAAWHDHRWGALYLLAVVTGARQGELLGLTWEDLDLEAGTLQIKQTLQRQKQDDGSRVWAMPAPKTPHSQRLLPIPPAVVTALKQHAARQKADRLAAGPAWAGRNLVFCGPCGQPLHGSEVTKTLQAVLAAAELPHLRFHDLRHCCASILTALGVPDRVIMDYLGHGVLGTTARYQHVPANVLRAASDEIERALGLGS